MSKLLILIGLSAVTAWAQVDIYSAKDLEKMKEELAQKRTQTVTKNLKRYGNHFTLLGYRDGTGSAEVHQHDADFFVVESGEAILVSGGTLVNSKTEKEGEIRGTSIQGGERHPLGQGDVVHIPAGVPHQLVIEKGKPFTYFVVKVSGQ